jgi:hypothetical protein
MRSLLLVPFLAFGAPPDSSGQAVLLPEGMVGGLAEVVAGNRTSSVIFSGRRMWW